MQPPIENQIANIKSLLQNPVVKQLIFMLGIAAGVALGIVLYMSIQEPLYRPLDYQVTPQNLASIVDTLEKAGIQYKMNEAEGVIMIPAKDVQLARVKLSAAGVPKDDGFNFGYLNTQSGIGSSQFLENARYLRALESDLSKTISAIDGVSNAKVHIAIPQNNVFADENGKPTASVVLAMAPGFSSDKEKIRSIVQIVASSVPGLDPQSVAITDQYGHYLSAAVDQDALYSAEQLNYQNKVQNYYEKRIQNFITPIIGDNKVNVSVYADIDFTQEEVAQEQYDPNQKAIRSEQTVSESSGGASGASGPPGGLSNSPPESDAEKQAASGQSGGGSGQGGNGGGSSGPAKTESTRNYEVSKSVSYKKSGHTKLKSLSVAVVVDNEMVLDPKTKKYSAKPLDNEKIKKITDLVKASIGFDEKRGDKVTVVNSSFNVEKSPEMVVAPTPAWDQPWFWDLIKKVIGIILGFVFLYVLYKRLSTYLKSNNNNQQIIPPKTNSLLSMYEDKEEDEELGPEIQGLKQDKINRLKELANRDPHRVAAVIKNWVGK